MTVEGREPILLSSDGDGAIAGFGLASGWAHETPRLRGVTERALQWLAATPGVDAQWKVDALVSDFWVTGSPRSVRIGLADVLRRSRRPPVPAPLTQTTPAPDLDARLLLRRWGLRGFGLQGWQRLGFIAADAGDVAAVLSRIGPRTLQLFAVNAEADIAVIPDTDGSPLPDPDFPPLVTPPVLLDAPAGFAMSWHVPRHDVVADELVRLAVVEAIEATPALGQTDASAASGAQWLHRGLGAQGSHTAILVPVGLSDEATSHLADRLRHWATNGPDGSELARAISSAHEARARSLWDLVHVSVEESLVGPADEPFAEPTAESARRSLAAIRESLIVVAPELSTAVRLADAQVVAEPEPIPGDTHRYLRHIRRGERRQVVVTAGSDGVGLRDAVGSAAIRRPDVAVVEGWPGGRLQVSALDGRQLTLDPAELTGGDRLAAQVRDLAPDSVVEHHDVLVASPALIKVYRQAGGWALTATVLMLPAALLAALLLLGAMAESEPGGNRLGYATVGLVFAGLAALAAFRVVALRRIGRSVGLGPWGQPTRTST